MRIGVSAFAWTVDFGEAHLEVLPKMREHGLTAFEIPMFVPAKLPAAKIRRAMEANDLACSVCAILPAGINPIDAEAETRKKSLAHLAACVEAAAEMGAKLIGGPVYGPIGYLPGHRRSAQEWNWAADCFQSLTSTLEAHGITLAIEPVNRSESHFLNTAKDARVLCDTINHPQVGVTIDTFHANIEEKNLVDAIRSLGGRLKHIHASENDRGLLGSGHVDFPAIVSALRTLDYRGCLMIEGFGYSKDERHAPGALWADTSVSPEDIAFDGSAYLAGLLN